MQEKQEVLQRRLQAVVPAEGILQTQNPETERARQAFLSSSNS